MQQNFRKENKVIKKTNLNDLSNNESFQIEKNLEEEIDDVGKISDNGDRISQIDKEEYRNHEDYMIDDVKIDPENGIIEDPNQRSQVHINPILENENEYNERSSFRDKKNNSYYSDNQTPRKLNRSASLLKSKVLKEKKKSLNATQNKMKNELERLKRKLEDKKEESRNRSLISNHNVSQMSQRMGIKNLNKSQNSKLIIQEIER